MPLQQSRRHILIESFLGPERDCSRILRSCLLEPGPVGFVLSSNIISGTVAIDDLIDPLVFYNKSIELLNLPKIARRVLLHFLCACLFELSQQFCVGLLDLSADRRSYFSQGLVTIRERDLSCLDVLAQCQDSSLTTHSFDIRSDISFSAFSKHIDVDIFSKRHPTCMY